MLLLKLKLVVIVGEEKVVWVLFLKVVKLLRLMFVECKWEDFGE